MNEIKNLIKGRRKGDKQTDIGRTMAMFREFTEEKRREHNKFHENMPGSQKKDYSTNECSSQEEWS